MKMCPTSCGLDMCSGDDACKDFNTTTCKIWALNDQCTVNPTMMLLKCPIACGVCSAVCEDNNRDCMNWATEGHCETNPLGMQSLCPQSCGICHKIEELYKVKVGWEKEKDEL